MNPALVTPLILTFNEEANIGRVLDRLDWAERIVVVDSYSTDDTLDILSANPRVEVFQRRFETFARQCNYGLERVASPWVLSLDADYLCPTDLAEEIRALPDEPVESGYVAAFRYVVSGRPLRGTLYPPRTVLYRRDRARYEEDGHAHRVQIDGRTGRLGSVIDHDDRKPLSMWFEAQHRYAQHEAAKLLATPAADLGLVDRIRRRKWIAPVLTPLYCLLVKGGVLDGHAGVQYALQRTYAEIALALTLYDFESTGRYEASFEATPDVPEVEESAIPSTV